MKRSFYGNLSEGDFDLAKQMQNPLGDIDSGLSALDYSAASDHSSTDSGSILQNSLSLPSAPKSTKGGNSKALEDDERRRIRRERNKMAAAKCRQKRVDQTNMLLEETQKLEAEQRKLKEDIQNYEKQKEELEFIIESHLLHCNMKREYGGPSTPIHVKTEEGIAIGNSQFDGPSEVEKSTIALKSENGKQFLVLHSDPKASSSSSVVGRDVKSETRSVEIDDEGLSAADPPGCEPAEARPPRADPRHPRHVTVVRPSFFVDPASANDRQGPSALFAFGLEPMMEGRTGLTPIGGLSPFAVSGSQILLTPVVSLPADSFQNLQAPPSSSSGS